MLGFLGIGAQKAGTTWLYEILRQHPLLAFPLGKEAHYWDGREPARDAAAVQRYLQHFQDPRRIEGEITPAYATLDEPAIACLRAAAPGLRLIFILRNPLERAWSAALMYMTFLDLDFAALSDAWFLDIFHSRASLSRGDYATSLERWCRYFPREALFTPRYETLGTAPEALLNACLIHIGVPALGPEDVAHLNLRRIVFSGPHHPPPPRLWQELRELYQERVMALGQLLGNDFSDWLVLPEQGPAPIGHGPSTP